MEYNNKLLTGFPKRICIALSAFVIAFTLIAMLSVTAFAAQTSFSFPYAADCYRDPAFPTKGNSFRAYNFNKPLVAYGTRGTTMLGSWTLESRGLYSGNSSDYPGSNNLDDVVADAAGEYRVPKTIVEVFELKNGGTHIAYGVLCGIFDGSALYIGDTWPGGGGYILSNQNLSQQSEISGVIEQDLTSAHNWVRSDDGHTTSCTGCELYVTITAKSGILPKTVKDCVTIETNLPETPDFIVMDTSKTPAVEVALTTSVEGNYQAVANFMPGLNPYADFTLSNPKTTAATGDNRPIELLVFGFAAMSVMAAAAFTMDRKRR